MRISPDKDTIECDNRVEKRRATREKRQEIKREERKKKEKEERGRGTEDL